MSMVTGKNLGSNAKSLLHVYQAQVLFKLQNAASFLVHLKSHKKAQVWELNVVLGVPSYFWQKTETYRTNKEMTAKEQSKTLYL